MKLNATFYLLHIIQLAIFIVYVIPVSGRVCVGWLGGGPAVLVHDAAAGHLRHLRSLDPRRPAGLRGHGSGRGHRDGPAREHRQQGHVHPRHPHHRPPVELREVQHGGERRSGAWPRGTTILVKTLCPRHLLQERRHQACHQLR